MGDPRSIENKKDMAIACAIFIVSALIFLTNRYTGGGDFAANELIPISVIRTHDLYMNEFAKPEPVTEREKFYAKVNDGLSEYFFRKTPQGNVVSLFPIVPGILNVPVFFMADLLGTDLFKHKQWLSHLTAIWVASLSGVAMFYFLRNITGERSTAVLFTLIYLFATCTWSIASRGLWQHGPSMLFVLTGLLLLSLKKESYVGFSGFFFALAVVNRPTNIFFYVAAAAYVVLNRPLLTSAAFAGWSAIPVVLNFYYYYTYWGSLLGPYVKASQAAIKTSDKDFHSISTTFMMWLISPSRGLLALSPFFIFGFLRMPSIWKNAKEAPFLKWFVPCIVLYMVMYAFVNGVGGWTFGYRYMTELVPFLVIFAALFWREKIRPHPLGFFSVSFAFFLTFSVVVQLLGAYVYPCGFDSKPPIDENRARVWYLSDSSLTRCVDKLVAK